MRQPSNKPPTLVVDELPYQGVHLTVLGKRYAVQPFRSKVFNGPQVYRVINADLHIANLTMMITTTITATTTTTTTLPELSGEIGITPEDFDKTCWVVEKIPNMLYDNTFLTFQYAVEWIIDKMVEKSVYYPDMKLHWYKEEHRERFKKLQAENEKRLEEKKAKENEILEKLHKEQEDSQTFWATIPVPSLKKETVYPKQFDGPQSTHEGFVYGPIVMYQQDYQKSSSEWTLIHVPSGLQFAIAHGQRRAKQWMYLVTHIGIDWYIIGTYPHLDRWSQRDRDLIHALPFMRRYDRNFDPDLTPTLQKHNVSGNLLDFGELATPDVKPSEPSEPSEPMVYSNVG